MQYKLNASDKGITNQLTGKKWNEDLAGVIQAWQDPATGEIKVSNGHHRIEMGDRHAVKDYTVRMIDAPDAKGARTVGALQNIADGRGTPMDAAKFFRDSGYTPETLEKEGISLSEGMVSKGLTLSNLSDSIFDRVATGNISEGRGLAIGKATSNYATQDAILKMIDKAEKNGRTVSDATAAELARFAAAAPTEVSTTSSLFGPQARAQNLALEKADVSSYIQRQLSQEKNVFGAVASEAKAQILGRAENTINAAKNSEISKGAAQAIEVYNRLSTRSGGVSEALDEAAKQISKGTNPAEAKRAAYERVRAAISETLGRRAESSVAGNPEDTPPTPAIRGSVESSALPGMADDIRANKESAIEEQGKSLSAEMRQSPKSIERAAGEMERNSPLFSGSEANPQGGLFSPRSGVDEAKAPPGASETAMGSDGKLHYRDADGNDLGAVK
jgi:hypothetical protein